jgi:phosphoribosylanthranilate isomerase
MLRSGSTICSCAISHGKTHTVDLQHIKVRVKVCGVTSLLDTLACMGAGADLIGFNFSTRSPRHVTVDRVAGILKEAPKGFQRVGVFQDAPVEQVKEAVRRLGLHYVQLHGSEEPEAYREAGVPLIKAFSIDDAADVERARASTADLLLLDSKSPLGGGSGQQFDWKLIAGLKRDYFLAGGLRAENVSGAILTLRPYGVDVCSGVEKAPGKKDKAALKEFVIAARAAEERMYSEMRGR